MASTNVLLDAIQRQLSAIDNTNETSVSHSHVSAGWHLAVFRNPCAADVERGAKTVESRFSMDRRPPYQGVSAGDIVFLKNGPVRGFFLVSKAQYFDFSKENIWTLRDRYESQIRGGESFWQAKRQCRYGSLFWIGAYVSLSPFSVPKTDRRTWVVLKRREDTLR